MKTIIAMAVAAIIATVLTFAVLKSKQADNEDSTNLNCSEAEVGISDDGSTVTFGEGISITIGGLDGDDKDRLKGGLIFLGCK